MDISTAVTHNCGAGTVSHRKPTREETGFPRWWEAGEIGENYVTLRNISQSNKRKEEGANINRAGTGI